MGKSEAQTLLVCHFLGADFGGFCTEKWVFFCVFWMKKASKSDKRAENLLEASEVIPANTPKIREYKRGKPQIWCGIGKIQRLFGVFWGWIVFFCRCFLDIQITMQTRAIDSPASFCSPFIMQLDPGCNSGLYNKRWAIHVTPHLSACQISLYRTPVSPSSPRRLQFCWFGYFLQPYLSSWWFRRNLQSPISVSINRLSFADTSPIIFVPAAITDGRRRLPFCYFYQRSPFNLFLLFK